MQSAIGRLNLALDGRTVLTEAATGAYAVTPVLAALAGARVIALGRPTRHASADEIASATMELAHAAAVADRVEIVHDTPTDLGSVDIVTNSGQVRPIDGDLVSHLRAGCVVPLMYESWEYRSADLDLEACRARGVAVAGTNERHPDVDVFSFLGPLAVHQLHDAGIAVHRCRVVVLCDNDFAPFITSGLERGGAQVSLASRLSRAVLEPRPDAVLVALKPSGGPVLTSADVDLLVEHAAGATVAQYWGDVDREALDRAGVRVWPRRQPMPGHMAVLLSDIGPDPIVRLQAGGLKVGEVLARGLGAATPHERLLVQPM